MTDNGCPHPESQIVEVYSGHTSSIHWCSLCGSYRWSGDEWRSPTALPLPGWTCSCSTFNGVAKEVLLECRHCGKTKPRVDQ